MLARAGVSPSMLEDIRRRERQRQAEDTIRSSAAVKSYLQDRPNRTLLSVIFEDLARHLAESLGWYEPCVPQAIRLLYVLDRAGEITIKSIWAAGALVTINTEVSSAKTDTAATGLT